MFSTAAVLSSDAYLPMKYLKLKLNISQKLQEAKCSTALCKICFAFPIWQLLLHISDNIRCWVTIRPDWVSTHQAALLVRNYFASKQEKQKLKLFCGVFFSMDQIMWDQ